MNHARAIAALLVIAAPGLPGYVRETFGGQPLRRDPQIRFIIDPKVVPGLRNADGAVILTPESDPVTALEAAMATWNTVPTASVNLQLTVGGIGPPGRDFVNSFSFDDTTATRSVVGTAIAVTTMTYDSTGVIVDSDIVFNPTYQFATTPTLGCFDVQAIATHELGHALGADHAVLTSATMFAYSAAEETWARHLSSDDIAFVSAAFPKNASGQGGILGTLPQSISHAVVLVINPATSFVVGAYAAGTAYSTGGLPPGDYIVVATPASWYVTNSDPPNWQTTFYGGRAPELVTVSGGQLARADIAIPDGPATLRIDVADFGIRSGGFAPLIPSGVPLDVQLIGAGFVDTIRPEDIVLYGPGMSIRADSVRVLPASESGSLGSISFTADVPPRTDWADVAIAVHSGETATVYSGARLMPAGLYMTPDGVVNAASFATGAVAPGEIVSLFGSAIGPGTPLQGAFDQSGKLTTQLAETVVEFDGQPAPLFYVSSLQINAQVPYEVAGRESTRIRVRYKDTAQEVILPVAAASPEIFSDLGRPAIFNQDGSMNDSAHPAPQGSIITAYGTGPGVTAPALATGAGAPVDPLSRAPQLTASINDIPAHVDFAGMAPGFAGLMQLNIAVPSTVPSGSMPLKLTANGIASSGYTYLWVR